MTKTDAEISQYFSALLAQHGSSYRVGDHGGPDTQSKRFRALLGILGRNGSTSLLDVGCGVGQLVDWLPQHPFGTIDYEGWDLNPELVTRARLDYPSRVFHARDLMQTEPLPSSWDYVVASGLFQFRDTAYRHAAVRRMLALCRRGVAYNCLSTRGDSPQAHEVQVDPLDEAAWLASLSPFMMMRHDYLPHDVTFYVYPRSGIA